MATDEHERDDPSASPRKSKAKLLGEFLREASVLILVFGILDGLLGHVTPLPWMYWAPSVLFASGLTLAIGILIETEWS